MKHDLKSQDILNFSSDIRKTILNMVHKAQASHVGSALSIVDVLAVLYKSPNLDLLSSKHISNRDSLILSKGHACTAVYATLHQAGLISEKLLSTYGADGSELMHHISHKAPGVDFSTGSLGHGLPVCVGLTLADKMNSRNNYRFCILGDGELAEGTTWEALLFAAHHQLSNLTMFVDYNNLQSLDTVERTLSLSPLKEKFESLGCYVKEINGHSHEQIQKALEADSELKPKVVIARTIKGKGVSFMENRVQWHYKNPTDAELEIALAELNGEKQNRA